MTLHQPDKRNAFSGEMARLLGEQLNRCDTDEAIRAVVLTGTPPAFCAGADLSAGGDTFAAPVLWFLQCRCAPLPPLARAQTGHRCRERACDRRGVHPDAAVRHPDLCGARDLRDCAGAARRHGRCLLPLDAASDRGYVGRGRHPAHGPQVRRPRSKGAGPVQQGRRQRRGPPRRGRTGAGHRTPHGAPVGRVEQTAALGHLGLTPPARSSDSRPTSTIASWRGQMPGKACSRISKSGLRSGVGGSTTEGSGASQTGQSRVRSCTQRRWQHPRRTAAGVGLVAATLLCCGSFGTR